MKKTIFTLSFIAAAYLLNAQVLYGTTSRGGKHGGGTICKLIAATNTLAAAFSLDGQDGESPEHLKLLQASDGKLYGTTPYGGDFGGGTIFSYDPAASAYKTVKSFNGTNFPRGNLVQASDGKLYGMTTAGGKGYGDIFSYDPATSTYTKLKDFDGTDGRWPYGNSLIQASDGKLYGMTLNGGKMDGGVIFSYDPATSAYKKLMDFKGANGTNPNGSLVQASDGKLYGMTGGGGKKGIGVIFSYDPATSGYTTLKDFDGSNGAYGNGSFLQASDGKLYGMTYAGGTGYGVIFSFDPATSAYTKLIDFNNTDGANPSGGLVQATDGKLYGMTTYGGSSDYGVTFSYDPASSVYKKMIDFDGSNGTYPLGSLTQASDGKLYGVTTYGGSLEEGVIFSYDPAISTYAKLRDFGTGTNNTGNYIAGALIKDQANKLYGMTSGGGSYSLGTIFSYDANTSAFNKLKDFDGTNGSGPSGSLTQASDGKLYGTTRFGGGGSIGYGVIFSYDPATSTYTKLKDFDETIGAHPNGSVMQASDGKLYGITSDGGSYGQGVIFSYDPVTSIYTKLKDFDNTNGGNSYGSLVQASDGKLYGMSSGGGSKDDGVIFSYDPGTAIYTKLKDFASGIGKDPYGSLIQANDGKLYGMTKSGGSKDNGVIFSYDPAASTYAKLYDFANTNGAFPVGNLMQAYDGKLYGMTSAGGSSYGVAFSYDPATSTYTKLSDFNGDNGTNPMYTSFVEIPGNSGIQISIADKSVIEGNRDKKFIAVPVALNDKSKKIIRFHYSTQNNTAAAGSDFVAQSGMLAFPPGLKRILLPIRIKGDETPEANETFSIILSDPVNATIADNTATVTIVDDDASSFNASQGAAKTMSAISLSPNPAQDKVKLMLTGYSGNVLIQLSNSNGRSLQQQKLQILSAKSAQHQINVGSYASGTYLITVIDKQGNRQTEKLVIQR